MENMKGRLPHVIVSLMHRREAAGSASRVAAPWAVGRRHCEPARVEARRLTGAQASIVFTVLPEVEQKNRSMLSITRELPPVSTADRPAAAAHLPDSFVWFSG